MSSPQLENGYLRIANELTEALARIRIPGQACQVLWVILRQTYGFGKKKDVITYGQISKKTGLSRSHSQRAVKWLVEARIVLKDGCRGMTTLEIQKDFSRWRVYPKKGTCTQNRVQGVPNNGYKTVPNNGYHKRKKDTYQKKPSTDALRLSGLLADLIAGNNPKNRSVLPKAKEKSVRRWAVDIDRMLRLDEREPNEVEEVITWSQGDDFWSSNILSGSKLREQYDKLFVQMRRDDKRGRASCEAAHLARRVY